MVSVGGIPKSSSFNMNKIASTSGTQATCEWLHRVWSFFVLKQGGRKHNVFLTKEVTFVIK